MLFFQLFAALVGAFLFFWCFIAVCAFAALATENWVFFGLIMGALMTTKYLRSRA
jgi:hypothetical protein